MENIEGSDFDEEGKSNSLLNNFGEHVHTCGGLSNYNPRQYLETVGNNSIGTLVTLGNDQNMETEEAEQPNFLETMRDSIASRQNKVINRRIIKRGVQKLPEEKPYGTIGRKSKGKNTLPQNKGTKAGPIFTINPKPSEWKAPSTKTAQTPKVDSLSKSKKGNSIFSSRKFSSRQPGLHIN